jgi:hypothetical protein
MDSIEKLISDIKIIRDRGINITMDGFITILEKFKEQKKKPELDERLMDFLFYLNDEGFINDYDFDYEEITIKFLKNETRTL